MQRCIIWFHHSVHSPIVSDNAIGMKDIPERLFLVIGHSGKEFPQVYMFYRKGIYKAYTLMLYNNNAVFSKNRCTATFSNKNNRRKISPARTFILSKVHHLRLAPCSFASPTVFEPRSMPFCPEGSNASMTKGHYAIVAVCIAALFSFTCHFPHACPLHHGAAVKRRSREFIKF